MSFLEFLRTDIGWRDYSLLLITSATMASFAVLVICREIKAFKYFLISLLLLFTIGHATVTYHEINYDLYKAEQYILEEDYYSAIYIYKGLLKVYPGLPKVVEAYNKCIEEMPDLDWLDLKEDFKASK